MYEVTGADISFSDSLKKTSTVSKKEERKKDFFAGGRRRAKIHRLGLADLRFEKPASRLFTFYQQMSHYHIVDNLASQSSI